MGLPIEGSNKLGVLATRAFTYQEIQNIERKLRQFGRALNRKDKADIYIEEAYAFMAPKDYWHYILDEPTTWWKLYFEFINYLQMNNWWPEDDLVGTEIKEVTSAAIPGYVVRVSIHPGLLMFSDGAVVGFNNSGETQWESQVYLDYPTAQGLAVEIGETISPLEDTKMNIRNIMKGMK